VTPVAGHTVAAGRISGFLLAAAFITAQVFSKVNCLFPGIFR
jgi:hypothetical protein